MLEFQIKEVIDAMSYGVVDETEGKQLLDELVAFSVRLAKVKNKLNDARRKEMQSMNKASSGTLMAAQAERPY